MITEIKNRMKKYGRKRCSDTRHLTFAFDVQRSTLNNEQVQYRHRLRVVGKRWGRKQPVQQCKAQAIISVSDSDSNGIRYRY